MKPAFDLHPDTMTVIAEIRRDKYMQPGETSYDQSCQRVADALLPEIYPFLRDRIAMPAGRVMAGAGTTKNVTWWNCFVSPLIQDSMRTDPTKPGKGIMDALASVAYSMQMGGGVGTDFSPLRPNGALVRRVQAPASGPLSFMDMWDSMCRTVMSAGYRRGAMMATLACDHPDIFDFIRAKHDPNRLRMFNVSVLVFQSFMEAVQHDEDWELGHWEPPFNLNDCLGTTVRQTRGPDPHNRPWYIYKRLPAREIWDALMRSTYNYAEPGVIFIDRVNYMNNLWYLEDVFCCNPCGEQMLAPDDNCNLSHNNLSRCTTGEPFTAECQIDHVLVAQSTQLLVRMSDNVIDLSPVPTEDQRVQAQLKRRIGLGITGLANMLMFLRLRYGSSGAISATEAVMTTIRNTAYEESIKLAQEKGPFPGFDFDQYLKGKFIQTLPEHIRAGIAKHGIRNSLLLTVAPTGTTSIAHADNSSGGLEPVYLARYERKILQPDQSFKTGIMEDFGFRVYANLKFDGDMDAALTAPLPDYMVTTADLTPRDHLVMQATVQKFVDNSVSKTINVPSDIAFEDFKDIYLEADRLECKGCTTYRPVPESGRGAVLSEIKKVDSIPNNLPRTTISTLRPRPDVLIGSTYRLRWAALPYPMFLTINDEILPDGRKIPFEIFINSKAVEYAHWITAFTRLVTSIMRLGTEFAFLPEELKQVYSARGGEMKGKQYIPSEVALIGHTIEQHFIDIGYIKSKTTTVSYDGGLQCPSCGELAVIHEQGCARCKACDWSNCG